MSDIVPVEPTRYDLAVVGPPSTAEWQNIERQAQALARTNFIPTQFRGKPGDIIAAFLMARELGIGPIQALNEIHIVDGAPGMSAHLMRSLVRKAGHKILVVESDNHHAIVEGTRRDGQTYRSTFTIDQAVQAGLCEIDAQGNVRARSRNGNKLNWESYTEDMLVARATSRCCRRLFEDVLLGYAYTADETREPLDVATKVLDVEAVLPAVPEGGLTGSHSDWIERLLTEHTESEVIAMAQTFVTTDRKIADIAELDEMPMGIRVQLATALRDAKSSSQAGEGAGSSRESSDTAPSAAESSAQADRESIASPAAAPPVSGDGAGEAPPSREGNDDAPAATSDPPSDEELNEKDALIDVIVTSLGAGEVKQDAVRAAIAAKALAHNEQPVSSRNDLHKLSNDVLRDVIEHLGLSQGVPA